MVTPLNSIVRAPSPLRTDDESLGRNYRALGETNFLLGMSVCNGRHWSLQMDKQQADLVWDCFVAAYTEKSGPEVEVA